MHHTIEERHIFPILAKRMPAFQDNDKHIQSHHGIHDGTTCSVLCLKLAKLTLMLGLDKLGELIMKWNDDPTAYSPDDMKECLDSWREVLFRHLDEEVSLGCLHTIFALWRL